jgi:hypothetical protein
MELKVLLYVVVGVLLYLLILRMVLKCVAFCCRKTPKKLSGISGINKKEILNEKYITANKFVLAIKKIKKGL